MRSTVLVEQRSYVLQAFTFYLHRDLGACTIGEASGAGKYEPVENLHSENLDYPSLMSLQTYDWPAVAQFRNRTAELARLERWWDDPSPEPMSMWGRRRVGKSWLFRRFAHGKPSIILVADRVSLGLQLQRMGRELEPFLGVEPRIDTLADLFTTLYRLSRESKVLVVIDEFPYLLGSTQAEQAASLTAIQAVMEQERDASQIKLVLTGSTIATMRDLLNEQNPLHGRLVPFQLRPLAFAHARQLMGEHRARQGCEAELTHFAIAGGMPRYLTALSGEDLDAEVTNRVLDPGGSLFNEPRALLASELREPAMYFSILATLAVKPALASEISAKLRVESRDLTVYLNALEQLHLVTRYEPVGSAKARRGATRWRCDDDFIRFWFRFVQPYQGELEAGADPDAFMRHRVQPHLAEHMSWTFERVVTEWMRTHYANVAPQVGSWWGNALNSLRRTDERSTEEIDVVVVDGRRVVAVAEAKWTNGDMTADVLTDLDNYKLPALAQAGFEVSGADIVLAAKRGFSESLQAMSSTRPNVKLLPADEMLNT